MLEAAFDRSKALLGDEAMARLAQAKVIIFGVGGVGSWCAEALLRTGITNLTIVDDDDVAPSNLNRQLPATIATVGFPKVEALRDRLLLINPDATITPIKERYTPSSERFQGEALSNWDCIVDAIDSVQDKAHLIRTATELQIPIFSSMGAALRTDPTKMRISKFSAIEGDGLARALRQRLRKDKVGSLPSFLCVHSIEVPLEIATRGSIMPVTASFGMALASLVIKHFSQLQNGLK